MHEMPYRYGPIGADGRTFSPTLHRMVRLSPAMIRLINALDKHGYVDTIRDGGTVGTVVALMDRGILREATPRRHLGTAGRHYPATTPEQVYAEACVEHGLRICDEIDAEKAAASAQLTQDIRNGNYTLVMGEPIVTPAQAHQRAVQEAAEAYSRGDIDDDGNWGQPDGMLGTVEADQHSSDYWEAATEGLSREPAFTEPITPAEARTGVSDAQASIADEVAALRRVINDAWNMTGHLLGSTDIESRKITLARLDRIAALVPQRATGDDGRALWLHETCGTVTATAPGPVLTRCKSCDMITDKWQALYTVAGR